MHPASFFKTLSEQKVRCELCPHECVLKEGQSGICGARINQKGELWSRNYGVVSALSLDPIEKKPLYHYHPGEPILSVGTVGCNLHCPFCQNESLSRYYDDQFQAELPVLSPEDLLLRVKSSGSFGLAYTYSEPIVWYEMVRDTAALLSDEGLKNVIVTNGFVNPEALQEWIPFLDAANVDLKAFDPKSYSKLGGRLQPVLETISILKEKGVHVELTTLLVPGINLEKKQLKELFGWIARLDRSIPLHLSRYFPHYRYSEPPTSLETMQEAFEEARSVLDFVYLGNVTGPSDTLCPNCGSVLVERSGYEVHKKSLIQKGHQAVCGNCGKEVHFVID